MKIVFFFLKKAYHALMYKETKNQRTERQMRKMKSLSTSSLTVAGTNKVKEQRVNN